MIKFVLEKLKALIPQNKFIKSATVLASGTIFGQVVVFTSYPILTRLYSPEDFGVLAVYSSILAILIVIAGFRYQNAIPLPATDASAINLMLLSLIGLVILTVIVSVLTFFLSDDIAKLTQTPDLNKYAWLFPISIFFGGIYQVFSFWAVRKKEYKVLAHTKLRQGSGMALSQVGMGFLPFQALGLIVGQIIGQFAGVTKLIKGAHKDIKFKNYQILKQVTFNRAKVLAYYYRDYPLFSTGVGLLNTVGRQVPPILLGSYFGPTLVGIYFLAHRILMAPVILITDSLSKVFLGDAADANRNKRLGKLVEQIQKFIIKLVFSPLIMGVFLAPELFGLVFGADWVDAGIVTQYLVPWLFLMCCVNPISPVYGVLLKQSVSLKIEVLMVLGRISVLIAGGIYGTFLQTIILYSIFSGIVILINIFWIYRLTNAGMNTWFTTLFKEALLISPFVSLLMLLKYVSLDILLWVIWPIVLFGFILRSFRIFKKGNINV